MHALALDRLDDEGRDIAPAQRVLERGQIVERNSRAIAEQRLEPLLENLIAIQRKRAEGQPVKGVFAGQDFRAPGRRTCELDRRLDRLGAGIGKEHLVEIGRLRQQPLRQNARERRNVHLDQIGQFGVENAFQRGPQGRMIAADAEHAEAAQKVEIARSRPVIEILAGAPPEADVITDGPEHPDHLLI